MTVDVDDKLNKAFHTLEFVHMARDCGGLTPEVENFGNAIGIDVQSLKSSYAVENHGSKTLEQVATEGLLRDFHTWIVEHKRKIVAGLAAFSVFDNVINFASRYEQYAKTAAAHGMIPMSKRTMGITVGIAICAGYLINRGILGLFNSMPGAIKAALAIPLPKNGSELGEYKSKVASALKARVWEDTREAKGSADEDSKKYSTDNPPTEAEVKEAAGGLSKAAQTAKHLGFVDGELERLAKTPAAQTPAGAAGLRWTSTMITRMIDDMNHKLGKSAAAIKRAEEHK